MCSLGNFREKNYFALLLQLLVDRLRQILSIWVIITLIPWYTGSNVSALSKRISPHGSISGKKLFTSILFIVAAAALVTVRIMPSGWFWRKDGDSALEEHWTLVPWSCFKVRLLGLKYLTTYNLLKFWINNGADEGSYPLYCFCTELCFEAPLS